MTKWYISHNWFLFQVANEYLDAHRNRGQLDIVDDFAHPLPVMVISKMLGVPIDDKDRPRSLGLCVEPYKRTATECERG